MSLFTRLAVNMSLEDVQGLYVMYHVHCTINCMDATL